VAVARQFAAQLDDLLYGRLGRGGGEGIGRCVRNAERTLRAMTQDNAYSAQKTSYQVH